MLASHPAGEMGVMPEYRRDAGNKTPGTGQQGKQRFGATGRDVPPDRGTKELPLSGRYGETLGQNVNQISE